VGDYACVTKAIQKLIQYKTCLSTDFSNQITTTTKPNTVHDYQLH